MRFFVTVGVNAIMPPCIQQVQSRSSAIGDILRDLRAGIDPNSLSLVILYFSPRPDVEDLAQAVAQAFAPVPVIGCSTSGEIGLQGYAHDSLVAVGLSGPDFHASCLLLENLATLSSEETYRALKSLAEANRFSPPGLGRQFALTLFDGFCLKEEYLSSAIHAVLGDIPVCGGSAGDGLRMRCSDVLYGGRIHRDCVVVALIATNRPVHIFKSEHFLPCDERLVVTGADVAHRIVTEINGMPAAQEYARLIGGPRESLSAVQFARHPLMVRVGGINFVRSIIHAQEDDSLIFACAIDVGLVLRLGLGVDMALGLNETFAQIRQSIGEPDLVLGFDCILRRLEIEDKGEVHKIGAIMTTNKVAGFSTQGEHFQGMHINQTFTGIAIGQRSIS